MNYSIGQYLCSKPGSQTIEHRAPIQAIREFYGEVLRRCAGRHDRKLQLRNLLISRLQINKRANHYAKLIGLYKLPDIEQWSIEQTLRKYEYTTFNNFSEMVASSHLFHVESAPDGKRTPYCRKPARYMAARVALTAYNEGDLETAIEKLWRVRSEKRLEDPLTLDFMESVCYTQLIASIRYLVQEGTVETSCLG